MRMILALLALLLSPIAAAQVIQPPPAVGGGGGGSPYPAKQSGLWYSAHVNATLGSGTNLSASARLYCSPFLQYDTVAITDIGARITTVSSGGNVQLTIYAANPTTLRPTGTPLAASGAISTTTAGSVSATLGAPVTLAGSSSGRVYFACANADNTAVGFYTIVAGSNLGSSYLGSSTMGNVANGPLSFQYTGQTYPALADLTSLTPTESTATTTVALYYKVQ